MQKNGNLNTKIHNLIRTNKSSVHDNCQKNKSKYDRASSVVAGPGAPSSSPLPPASVQLSCGGWGYVRRSRGWRSRPSTIGSGGGVAKGAPKPDGTPPPVAAYGVAEPDGTGPPPVAASGVADPHGTAPLRSTTPPPPPTLPPPTPRLHAVPSRGSPPSSPAIAPVSAGSRRAGLLSAVYHRSSWRCRETSRPTETPVVVCHQCCNPPK
jgi:hypothetical protein